MKEYHVWVEIEEHNLDAEDEEEEYVRDPDPEKLGTYATEEEAIAHKQRLIDEVEEQDLQMRINTTVGLVRGFNAKCAREEHTDTGDAWDVLNEIEGLWAPLYKVE